MWKHGATSPTFTVATYKPFGTPVSASGTEKFEYAGEMLVGAAGSSPGLYYIGARWMDPELGRWYSLDPEFGKLSMPQSLNRYVYCVNNPLRFKDPTGEKHRPNLVLFPSYPVRYWGDWPIVFPGISGWGEAAVYIWYILCYYMDKYGPDAWEAIKEEISELYLELVTPPLTDNDHWWMMTSWRVERDPWSEIRPVAKRQVQIQYGIITENDDEIYDLWHANINDWTYCLDQNPIDWGVIVTRHIPLGYIYI